jgi:hypothetical protein
MGRDHDDVVARVDDEVVDVGGREIAAHHRPCLRAIRRWVMYTVPGVNADATRRDTHVRGAARALMSVHVFPPSADL